MRIKIYTTQTCPFCDMAKDFFKRKKLPFTEVDVSANHKAADEMVKKSGQSGVPVIEIDNEIIKGFDVPRINEILAKKSKGK